MRIKLTNILVAINILTLLLVVTTVSYPSSLLRIILGIPFLLFVPGYTTVAALLTVRKGINSLEGVALSFALGIAVVPLIGFILNFTPWGIRLEPVLYSVAFFVFVTSVIAWLRQKRVPEPERHALIVQFHKPGQGKGMWDQVLTMIMVVTAMGALGAAAYFVTEPKLTESFTQFYILEQPEGAVAPQNLKVGEESSVTLVIANHEGSEVSYHVQVLIDGEKNAETGPIILDNEHEWQAAVGFVPKSAGKNQKVEFQLYRDSEAVPYLEPLYLWIDVGG